jgi:hypothetical protein
MTKRIPERKRAKVTGRGKGPSFLRLTHHLLDSEEFGALSAHATKLLIELARKYKGNNNGDLSCAWSDCRKRGWRSKAALQRARDELLAACFIIVTRHGGKHVSSLYALTFEPIDACEGKGLEIGPTTTASHAWRKNKNGAP